MQYADDAFASSAATDEFRFPPPPPQGPTLDLPYPTHDRARSITRVNFSVDAAADDSSTTSSTPFVSAPSSPPKHHRLHHHPRLPTRSKILEAQHHDHHESCGEDENEIDKLQFKQDFLVDDEDFAAAGHGSSSEFEFHACTAAGLLTTTKYPGGNAPNGDEPSDVIMQAMMRLASSTPLPPLSSAHELFYNGRIRTFITTTDAATSTVSADDASNNSLHYHAFTSAAPQPHYFAARPPSTIDAAPAASNYDARFLSHSKSADGVNWMMMMMTPPPPETPWLPIPSSPATLVSAVPASYRFIRDEEARGCDGDAVDHEGMAKMRTKQPQQRHGDNDDGRQNVVDIVTTTSTSSSASAISADLQEKQQRQKKLLLLPYSSAAACSCSTTSPAAPPTPSSPRFCAALIACMIGARCPLTASSTGRTTTTLGGGGDSPGAAHIMSAAASTQRRSMSTLGASGRSKLHRSSPPISTRSPSARQYHRTLSPVISSSHSGQWRRDNNRSAGATRWPAICASTALDSVVDLALRTAAGCVPSGSEQSIAIADSSAATTILSNRCTAATAAVSQKRLLGSSVASRERTTSRPAVASMSVLGDGATRAAQDPLRELQLSVSAREAQSPTNQQQHATSSRERLTLRDLLGERSM